VAYYLHGLWGRETDWTRQGALPAAADSLARLGRPELIVVMPDGDDSWYTTWHALGNGDACRADTARREPAATYCVPWPRYDEYVARDLVARVDSAYRTRGDRAHRAVAGLSMGGYGAVSLALRYPDVFAAAASHSGVLSPLFAGPRPIPDTLGAASVRWAPSVDSLRALYRGYWTTLPLAMGATRRPWWARDPGRAGRRACGASAGPAARLYADVGTGDVLLARNRAFRATMTALGVALEYREWRARTRGRTGGRTSARASRGSGRGWAPRRTSARHSAQVSTGPHAAFDRVGARTLLARPSLDRLGAAPYRSAVASAAYPPEAGDEVSTIPCRRRPVRSTLTRHAARLAQPRAAARWRRTVCHRCTSIRPDDARARRTRAVRAPASATGADRRPGRPRLPAAGQHGATRHTVPDNLPERCRRTARHASRPLRTDTVTCAARRSTEFLPADRPRFLPAL
jgi:S-formylglutathione hydrolase FrmB